MLLLPIGDLILQFSQTIISYCIYVFVPFYFSLMYSFLCVLHNVLASYFILTSCSSRDIFNIFISVVSNIRYVFDVSDFSAVHIIMCLIAALQVFADLVCYRIYFPRMCHRGIPFYWLLKYLTLLLFQTFILDPWLVLSSVCLAIFCNFVLTLWGDLYLVDPLVDLYFTDLDPILRHLLRYFWAFCFYRISC